MMQLILVLVILLTLLITLISSILIFVLFSSFYSDFSGSPYVPNHDEVIHEALKLADVSPRDTFMDLGCGNGKVLLHAIKHFGVQRAIGYEIAPWPYLVSRFRTSKTSAKVQIYRKSILDAELSEADVIYTYLSPKLLKQMSPKLEQAKKNNKRLRIVSPVFKIDGLKIKKTATAYHKGFHKEVKIFLY